MLTTLCCGISLLQWLWIVVLLLVSLLIIFKVQFWQFTNILQVRPHWFLGNSSFGGMSLNDNHKQFYEATSGHKYAIYWDGWKPCLYIRDLDLVKKIQVTDFDHFTDMAFVSPNYIRKVGNQFGVVDVQGEEWRSLKKLVTSPFSIPRLRKTTPMMNVCAKQLINHMTKVEASNGVLDSVTALKNFCLNVIASVGFGIDINSFEDKTNEFKNQAESIINFSKFIFVNQFPALASFLRVGLLNSKNLNYFKNMVEQIDNARKSSTAEIKDIMGNLIKASEEHPDQMNKEILYNTVVQFFADGYTTAGDALSVVFYLLALHPEVQEKAQEEIDQVFDDKSGDSDLTEDDLKSLPYLEQIYNEALRLGCVAFTVRACTKEYKLPGENFVVPKDMKVFIPIYGLHHDEKYWENPYKFDPDRWSSENKNQIKTGTYQPFGFGPRSCLGINLVKVESKIMLAHVLRNFSLNKHGDMPERILWGVNGFAEIQGGVNLKLTRRF